MYHLPVRVQSCHTIHRDAEPKMPERDAFLGTKTMKSWKLSRPVLSQSLSATSAMLAKSSANAAHKNCPATSPHCNVHDRRIHPEQNKTRCNVTSLILLATVVEERHPSRSIGPTPKHIDTKDTATDGSMSDDYKLVNAGKGNP